MGDKLVKCTTYRSPNITFNQETQIHHCTQTPCLETDYVSAVEEVYHWLPLKLAAELRADTSKLLDKTHPQTQHHHTRGTRPLKKLRTDQSRIILTVDKGTAMVVIDRQDCYNSKVLVLLHDKATYRLILKDPTPKYKSQLINLLRSCKT